ncbi:MAG TPA: hypothetical protein PLC98_19550 [Anaerolineales bacterium]|nr:hypothetical protein [Anaerolineales bacterium]
MEMHVEDLVLVAVVPTAHDLEIARVLGWYRIPVRRAPKMVAVDWLAIYQTASCGLGPAGIYAVAPVLGHELTTRVDLFRDQVDHLRAREAYYKLQLGPMEALPTPIVAEGWARLTFLYTTGRRLLKATSLKALRIPASEERQALWRALRERATAYKAQPAPTDSVALTGLTSLFARERWD